MAVVEFRYHHISFSFFHFFIRLFIGEYLGAGQWGPHIITQTQSCPKEPHSPGGEADPLCIYPSEPGTHLCMNIKIEKTCFLKWFTNYVQGASCEAVPPVFRLMELFPRGDTSRTTRRARRLTLHSQGSVSRRHSPLCLPQDSQRIQMLF